MTKSLNTSLTTCSIKAFNIVIFFGADNISPEYFFYIPMHLQRIIWLLENQKEIETRQKLTSTFYLLPSL